MTLTLDQAASLLAVAAAFDQRTIGRADATAWQSALAEFEFDEVRDAIVTHYRDHRERLTVADIRGEIVTSRRAREDTHRRARQLETREATQATRLALGLVGTDPDAGRSNSPQLEAVHTEAMTVPCPPRPKGCGQQAGMRCVNHSAVRDPGAPAPATKIPHPLRLRNATRKAEAGEAR